MITRKKTRAVKVGDVVIGGDAPISVQSMTNTDTRDAKATIAQIRRLEEAGCEIVRMAVPDRQAAEALRDIRSAVAVPLVADIHFDYRLALLAIEAGIDKLRINPGNIGERDRVRQVVAAAKERRIPIRIGVNGGSLDRALHLKYGGPTAEALAESAMEHVRILEDLDFSDTVISMKSSSVQVTVEAYRLLSEKADYPLHIGITEAGTSWRGTVKSCAGLGALLMSGFGDTLRVSLTGDPVEEVRVGHELLEALDLRRKGIRFVSCPTCGRCQVNLEAMVTQLEAALAGIELPITIAVMGCAVNGPGEAQEADLGLASGKGEVLLFKKGKIIRKLREDEVTPTILDMVKNWSDER